MNPRLFAAIRFLFRRVSYCCPTLFARWGLYFWGATYRPPWRRWERAILQSAKREFRPIENEQIAIYHWGQGAPPILLLPGWNSRASHFKHYIEQLTRAGYSVIGFDPVGHGHSSGNGTNVRQYLAVVDVINEKYGPFHTVIGHSFGGFCIPYALNHYRIATKAVLLSSPSNLEWLFQRFTEILHAPPSVCRKMQQQIEQLLGEDCWQKYSVSEHAKLLGHVPVMIVHDENDQGVPLIQGENNQAVWPNSLLLVTQKLGHHRTLRHPSAVKPVIHFIQQE